MDNVTNIETAADRFRAAVAAEKAAKAAALSRHPAGRRIQQADRCPECSHTMNGHTAKAEGCAYCDCQRKPAEGV